MKSDNYKLISSLYWSLDGFDYSLSLWSDGALMCHKIMRTNTIVMIEIRDATADMFNDIAKLPEPERFVAFCGLAATR